MSAPLVFGPIAMAVFVAGMWIGYPLVQRRAQARADAMVDHLLSGLAPDPGEVRSHRSRLPREWNDLDLERDSRPAPQGTTATYVPAHASDAVAGWDLFTYPGRHAQGSVRPIVGIEARAAYDAAVLTVQSVIDSVRRARMWTEATS